MYVQGPAIVKRGGVSIYFADGLNVSYDPRTKDVTSDFHGKVDSFLTSRVVKVSGRPEGMIRNLSSFFALGVGNVGGSVFGATKTPLEIHTKAGEVITYPKSGVTKMPTLKLSAVDDFFQDDIEWTCLGDEAKQPTAADFWKTITAGAFADATYDETKLLRYQYTATYGGAPFDAMTAHEGFTLAIEQENQEIPDSNLGLVADIGLRSISGTCRFIPSNLTEAQIDSLLKLQGTGAVRIGESIAKGATDLVITGNNGVSSFTATLHKAGFASGAFAYKSGQVRAGEVVAMTRRTWTAGVGNPLYTFAIGT